MNNKELREKIVEIWSTNKIAIAEEKTVDLIKQEKIQIIEDILKFLWEHRTANNEETLFIKLKLKDFEKFKNQL